ncbi:MAG: ABC transporter permease [Oscillospiraceae bacterium]|nr:ABC transporter permease [Oscillospiraceae bacterium]
MFRNIFGKRIIGSIRDRGSLVWTLIFPLVLATLFYIVFSGIDAAGMLNRFPLGVVNDAAFQENVAFRTAIESVSDEDGLFELILHDSVEEANVALENGEIRGYIIVGEIPTLIVTMDGIEQTVAKTFLDRYLQMQNSIEHVMMTNPAALANLVPMEFTEEISLSHNPPSGVLNFFYALLAMTAMYGAFQGGTAIIYLQANLSALGARRTVSPAKRWKVIFYDLLAALAIHFTCMMVLLAFMNFVLGIDFGQQIGFVILTCFVGSMLGISFGALLSVTPRLKEGAKISIMLAVTMVCVFLAGLMVGGINYIIAERVPILAWINPAARLVDAFYALYFFDTYERFALNIVIVLGMSIVMFIMTAILTRRQRYESI